MSSHPPPAKATQSAPPEVPTFGCPEVGTTRGAGFWMPGGVCGNSVVLPPPPDNCSHAAGTTTRCAGPWKPGKVCGDHVVHPPRPENDSSHAAGTTRGAGSWSPTGGGGRESRPNEQDGGGAPAECTPRSILKKCAKVQQSQSKVLSHNASRFQWSEYKSSKSCTYSYSEFSFFLFNQQASVIIYRSSSAR